MFFKLSASLLILGLAIMPVNALAQDSSASPTGKFAPLDFDPGQAGARDAGSPSAPALPDGREKPAKPSRPSPEEGARAPDPTYAPADTANIADPDAVENKAENQSNPPIQPKLDAVPPMADLEKRPEPAKEKAAVPARPPQAAVPGYRYQAQPSPRPYPPQYYQPAYPQQYYLPRYAPPPGYWQSYQPVQPPRWAYPPMQRPLPNYRFPPPGYWYPYPPQGGWPQQVAPNHIPRGNGQTGN